MAYAIKIGSNWHEITGPFQIGEGEDAISYPANWPELATDEERADLGILEVEEVGPPPSDVMVDGSTLSGDDAPVREWVTAQLSLEDLKALYRTRAEAVRDTHLNGGCDTPSGRVDTDFESRLNISGSVQMAAMLGDGFNVSWRRADNSYITLDATAMAAVGLAAGEHVANCYGTCFAIKDAIAAAANPAAVRAVDLEAGYPA